MKIVFMGTPQPAAVSLDRLITEGHEIVAVYTQPDRPSGRGKKIALSPVKELALRHKITVFQPFKIKTQEALEEFSSLKADIVVVVAYGRVLPVGFLNAFPHGAINVHFSLLPKYRGAAPVNWAIINGESETGVTTMRMDSGLDTGDVLLQRSVTIGRLENAMELMARLSRLGADLLSETLEELDSIDAKRQVDAEASYAPMMKKEDGLIDWRLSADQIERRVRGFQPFPTSYTFHDRQRLTIWKSHIAESSTNEPPGSVIAVTGSHLVVACGIGTSLAIEEIQPEGKRRMGVRDFLNGSKLRAGDMLTSSPTEVGASN